MNSLPKFIITIDTEGDNIWQNRKFDVTTKNARYLPRFQALCDRFDFKVTYLVNYEMSVDPFFVDFAKDALSRNVAEIGMHLHGWNSPPNTGELRDDCMHHAYLTEYSSATIYEKVRYMTHLLEDTFDRKVVSHRGGRWAFDAVYANILAEAGYEIDCTVTPLIDWSKLGTDLLGVNGPDFRRFLNKPYFVDLNRIDREGSSSLLEVPMTIRELHSPRNAIAKISLLPGNVRQRLNQLTWLRPSPTNYHDLIRLIIALRKTDASYAMFMLHSSELMPGGSPSFATDKSIEKLYSDMTRLFEFISCNFRGATLTEFARSYIQKQQEAP